MMGLLLGIWIGFVSLSGLCRTHGRHTNPWLRCALPWAHCHVTPQQSSPAPVHWSTGWQREKRCSGGAVSQGTGQQFPTSQAQGCQDHLSDRSGLNPLLAFLLLRS